MVVTPIKTAKVLPGRKTITQILDESIDVLSDGDIVVITSKIVALAENRVVPIEGTDKDQLIKQESDLYLPAHLSKYDYHFTITKNTLISVAGIDESNSGGDYYVLWPKDSQSSANKIRKHLSKRFGLKKLGVIISDSTCIPLRWGTVGIPLGFSGFKATKSYIGKPDLFGRSFNVSKSGVALGLTAAAVLTMGEGTEQTPIALIKDVPFVEFQDHNPSKTELEDFYISDLSQDLFAPFLQSVEWTKGGSGKL